MTRPPSEAVEGQNSHHLQKSSDPATTRCHVGSSLAPDVSDPLVRYRGVDNRVRDRAMAHKGLKRACIDSPTSQSVSSCVAQHVGVDREWQLSSHIRPTVFDRP